MNIVEDRLKQSSSGVVLCAAKCFLLLTQNSSRELRTQVIVRLKDPLITLIATATHEIAYVVLMHFYYLMILLDDDDDDEDDAAGKSSDCNDAGGRVSSADYYDSSNDDDQYWSDGYDSDEFQRETSGGGLSTDASMNGWDFGNPTDSSSRNREPAEKRRRSGKAAGSQPWRATGEKREGGKLWGSLKGSSAEAEGREAGGGCSTAAAARHDCNCDDDEEDEKETWTQSPLVRLFTNDYKFFFCSYTDPSYIKLVKLDILLLIVSKVGSGEGNEGFILVC